MFSNIPEVLGVWLWNGQLCPDERPRAPTLVLEHPNALAGKLLAPEAGLAERYLHSDPISKATSKLPSSASMFYSAA